MKIVFIAVIFCITGNPCVWRDHTGRNVCASSAYTNVSNENANVTCYCVSVSNRCVAVNTECVAVRCDCAIVSNENADVTCHCVGVSNRCVAVNIECVAVRRINITNKDGVYKNTTRCLRATGGLAQAGV